MNTFKHSGELGDIIYSLPTIKTLGGGILYLDVAGGESDPACIAQCFNKKNRFNKTSYDFIRPLLLEQPYIGDVRVYGGEDITYNLDTFRNLIVNEHKIRSKTKNLLDIHLQTFDLPEWDCNEPWLFVKDPITLHRSTMICRSPRYQSSFLWFFSNARSFSEQAIFLGLPKEHELFEYMLEIKIPYYPVRDALELARIILGSKLFISNGTFGLSVGIGLGSVPIIQELYKPTATCVFPNKKNMQYISL